MPPCHHAYAYYAYAYYAYAYYAYAYYAHCAYLEYTHRTKAAAGRDAFVKAIYQRIFDLLVRR